MAAEALALPHTMIAALTACGAMANNPSIFNGQTIVAKCTADKIFDNDFETCMDKSFKELEDILRHIQV